MLVPQIDCRPAGKKRQGRSEVRAEVEGDRALWNIQRHKTGVFGVTDKHARATDKRSSAAGSSSICPASK
jgi:hypothetical protein